MQWCLNNGKASSTARNKADRVNERKKNKEKNPENSLKNDFCFLDSRENLSFLLWNFLFCPSKFFFLEWERKMFIHSRWHFSNFHKKYFLFTQLLFVSGKVNLSVLCLMNNLVWWKKMMILKNGNETKWLFEFWKEIYGFSIERLLFCG